MVLNGSQILANVLIENEVDTIFGYPGGAVLNIYDALYEYSDKITHIMTAHEQGAAHAADGYARATGKTGVCLATSGPGATNLVTGIATAYMDSVPMVAITGNVPNSLIGRDSFQEVYIAGITMPITKHNFVVRKIEDLAPTLRTAFKIAISGRPGPVLVDIPKDITAAVTEYTAAPKQKAERQLSYSGSSLEEIAEAVNKARRPVIVFGGGVKGSNADKILRRIIEKANIPATHTLMAAGVLRWDMPENLGMIGMHGSAAANKAVNDADVVVTVGSRFSDRVALAPGKFARKATMIHIDIDQSEIDKNVKTDLHVVGDAETVLGELEPLLDETKHSEWFAQIDSMRRDIPYSTGGEMMHPREIMEIISEIGGEDALCVTDVGQHQMWAAQYLHHTKAENFLTSGGLGTLGYGYGAAIGAQIGTGRKPVFHITGDGSFHMNMNEACTAVTYNTPVISICLNNTVLGMVRQWQTSFYGKRYSSTDPGRKTNYVKVAEGFGLKGYSCKTADEFRAALKEAVALNAPVWIECMIGKDEKVLPMIPGGGTVDDIIYE